MPKKTRRKKLLLPFGLDQPFPDTLEVWFEAYFAVEVTTAESSQKVRRRDLQRFLDFVEHEEGRHDREV